MTTSADSSSNNHNAPHKSTMSISRTKLITLWLVRFTVKTVIVAAVISSLLAALGLAQQFGWLTTSTAEGDSGTKASSASSQFVCPMLCTPPLNEAGRCPVCGMELVESHSQSSGDSLSVNISPAARRLAGIQTAKSELRMVERTIRTVGSIAYDESRLATISAYVDGRIESLFADYVGVPVEEGDDLALIYSPDLFTAQTEYVASLGDGTSNRLAPGISNLQSLALEKLRELGMTDSQIDELKQSQQPESRIRVASPQSGTVLEKNAVNGKYVKAGDILYKIADLSSVWLMLDIFPSDAAVVRFGQRIEAELASMPGVVFTGRIAFIDRTVNPKTRTVGVRVEITNLDGKLRPGDFATARIKVPAVPTEEIYDPALAGKYISPMHPQVLREKPGDCPICGMKLISTSELGFTSEPIEAQEVVTVPRNAVLHIGDESIVYVETEPGKFEIRRVTLGATNDSDAVILSGLIAGETVATDGNFLIDSQMQLSGNPSLLDPEKAVQFPPGPLPLPNAPQPAVLTGIAAESFDSAYTAYFEIQNALAEDELPKAIQVNTLLDQLIKLETSTVVPDMAQLHLASARQAAASLSGSMEATRNAFRDVSHSMLRAAMFARGPSTSKDLLHMYCPMVPGGGGDWMQPGGKLANPYWGSQMLRCGETVKNYGSEQ